MARLFDDGANEYLEIASTAISGYPLTLACWYYTDDDTISETLIQIQDSGSGVNFHKIGLTGHLPGDTVRAQSRNGLSSADTTTSFSTNVWQHACGVFAANNDRRAFLNGGSKGTTAVISNDTGFDSMSIGRSGDSTPGSYMSGRIAEAVILRIAATDYQAWLHAQGVPAPSIWPGWAIAAYYPLFTTDRDFPAGYFNMAPFNTPGWAPHPPKVLEYWRRYRQGR